MEPKEHNLANPLTSPDFGLVKRLVNRTFYDDDRGRYTAVNPALSQERLLVMSTIKVNETEVDADNPDIQNKLEGFYESMPEPEAEYQFWNLLAASDPDGNFSLTVQCPHCKAINELPAMSPLPPVMRPYELTRVFKLRRALKGIGKKGPVEIDTLKLRVPTLKDGIETWPMRHMDGDLDADRAKRTRCIIEPKDAMIDTAVMGQMALGDVGAIERWMTLNRLVRPSQFATCQACSKMIIYARATSPFFY